MSPFYGQLRTPAGTAGVLIEKQEVSNREQIRLRIKNNHSEHWFELLISRDSLREAIEDHLT